MKRLKRKNASFANTYLPSAHGTFVLQFSTACNSLAKRLVADIETEDATRKSEVNFITLEQNQDAIRLYVG